MIKNYRPKIGRNATCPRCDSGRKWKNCCLRLAPGKTAYSRPIDTFPPMKNTEQTGRPKDTGIGLIFPSPLITLPCPIG